MALEFSNGYLNLTSEKVRQLSDKAVQQTDIDADGRVAQIARVRRRRDQDTITRFLLRRELPVAQPRSKASCVELGKIQLAETCSQVTLIYRVTRITVTFLSFFCQYFCHSYNFYIYTFQEISGIITKHMHRPALIRAAFGKYADFLSTSYPLVSMSGIFFTYYTCSNGQLQ